METLPAAFVRRFRLLGTKASEMAVPSRPIVEGIDVVCQVGNRKLSVLGDLLLDPFLLQAAKEGLRDGVVPAVALPAHTRFEMIRSTSAPISRAAERSEGDDAGLES